MIEFNSNAQALTWIFLFGFWLTVIIMSLTLKGRNGNNIGLLYLLQFVFSLVIGLNFYQFSPIISIAVIGVGLIMLSGMNK